MLNTLRAIHRRLGLKYRVMRVVRWVRRFGCGEALRTYRRIHTPGGAVQEIMVPGLPHPVLVRAGTADVSTFEKMFVWNDYDLAYPPDVKTVIDAGGNNGLSAIYFANRFPQATIVAIEPEQRNFELLQRNTRPYPRVVPLRAALWSEETTLSLSNPGDRVDSYRFGPHGGNARVEALSVCALLERFGMRCVDVLKIDIEGGETAVFQVGGPWIDSIRMFVIELHGPEAGAAFADATAHLEAKRYRRGENHIVLVNSLS